MKSEPPRESGCLTPRATKAISPDPADDREHAFLTAPPDEEQPDFDLSEAAVLRRRYGSEVANVTWWWA
jgi:hypothetical protein